jgi:hypothetical protein
VRKKKIVSKKKNVIMFFSTCDKNTKREHHIDRIVIDGRRKRDEKISSNSRDFLSSFPFSSC